MTTEILQKNVLAWFDENQRALPWRQKIANPYHVWLSEMMLQQTTVATVVPYFLAFIERWPTVVDLAAASLDEVLHAWQGLGYYARARYLHQAAQYVVNECGAQFPSDEDQLMQLPGVGPYVAAAIVAIAFDKHAIVVDGNIMRIVSRVHTLAMPKPNLKDAVKDMMTIWTPVKRAGDFAQSLMDLATAVCRPKNPQCTVCPLNSFCGAYKTAQQMMYPVKALHCIKPHYQARVYWLENSHGDIWIRKRPERGLLAGLWELPTSACPPLATGFDEADIQWHDTGIEITHVFTHFKLTLRGMKSCQKDLPIQGGEYLSSDRLEERAFSTLMRKVIRRMKTAQLERLTA